MCFLHGLVFAQAWPNKPIKWVVPFPAAGGTDAVARALASQLGQILKQTVVVDNRAGANGLIGAQYVATAPADGYTVLMTIASHAIAPSIYKQLPYDTDKDFMAVSLVAKYPYLITVPMSLPVNTLKEFIDYAKHHPGAVSFASSGTGSGPHLGMELLADATGIIMVHIPYKGAAPANNDLIGGQVQAMLNNLMAGSALIKGNKLKVLAVTSLTRSAALPNVATVVESGFPNFEVVSWYGVFLPAKTPEAVVNQLSRAIHVSLSDKELLQRLSKDGATAIGSTPQEFAEFFSADKAKWQKVASKLNITLD
jgi:tripartite-type tricarboxylate transporter receptor subunit TctC